MSHIGIHGEYGEHTGYNAMAVLKQARYDAPAHGETAC